MMDMLFSFAIVCSIAIAAIAFFTVRRAERHTRLQPKFDIRRYDVGPNDFLALTPEHQLTDEQAKKFTDWMKDRLDIRVIITPPNTQISVIRKLAYGQMAHVRQEVTGVIPQACPTCGSTGAPEFVKRAMSARLCTDEWHSLSQGGPIDTSQPYRVGETPAENVFPNSAPLSMKDGDVVQSPSGQNFVLKSNPFPGVERNSEPGAIGSRCACGRLLWFQSERDNKQCNKCRTGN